VRLVQGSLLFRSDAGCGREGARSWECMHVPQPLVEAAEIPVRREWKAQLPKFKD